MILAAEEANAIAFIKGVEALEGNIDLKKDTVKKDNKLDERPSD